MVKFDVAPPSKILEYCSGLLNTMIKEPLIDILQFPFGLFCLRKYPSSEGRSRHIVDCVDHERRESHHSHPPFTSTPNDNSLWLAPKENDEP